MSGEYKSGLQSYNEGLKLLTGTYKENTPSVGVIYSRAGTAHDRLGQFKAAYEHHNNAISILGGLCHEFDCRLAEAYHNFGLLYDHTNHPTAALDYYNKALGIFKKICGPNHPQLGMAHCDMGRAYTHAGNFKTALNNLLEGLKVYVNRATGEIELAAAYTAIAEWCNAVQDYSQARTISSRAEEMLRKAKQDQHILHLDIYNAMGLAYSRLDQVEKAIESYEKAVKIAKRGLNNHPSVREAYNGLGEERRKLGQHKAALQAHKKAEQSLSPEESGEFSLELAQTRHRLGLCFTGIKDLATAITYHTQAAEVFQKAQRKSELAETYFGLGAAYEAQKQNQQALDSYTQASTLLLDAQGEKQIDLARAYTHIGLAYYNMQNNTAALSSLSNAEGIIKTLSGERCPHLADIYYNFGVIYTSSDLTKALNYLKQASKIVQEPLDASQIASEMSAIHRRLGNTQEAAECQIQAMKLSQAEDLELAQAHEQYAAALARVNNHEKEIKQLEKAVKLLEPHKAIAKQGLAKIYNQLNDACLNLGRTKLAKEYQQKAKDCGYKEAAKR